MATAKKTTTAKEPATTSKSTGTFVSKKRNSSVELLKIITMFLLVINHVINILNWGDVHYEFRDFVLDTAVASTDWKYIFLTGCRYFGPLGNTMFFVCSAWYLLDSDKYNRKKWFNMLLEVWFISVVFLVVTMIIRKGNVSSDLLLRSILPSTFENNWYITCYLIFYPIHSLLNIIIHKLDRKQLYRVALTCFIVYFGINTIKSGLFYFSNLTLWISIYFVMAYLKLYKSGFCDDEGANLKLLLVGIICTAVIAAATNAVGLLVPSKAGSVLHWVKNNNPFLLIIVIAVFNRVRVVHFENGLINYISGLTLLIYIIHENILFRVYFRTAMWRYVFHTFGYEHVVLWALIQAVLVFAFGLICSIIYDKTIRSVIKRISDGVYELIRTNYLKWESAVLK